MGTTHSLQTMSAFTVKAHFTNGNGNEGGTPLTTTIGSASMAKVFEPERLAEFDGPAKALGIMFWKKLGYDCRENPEECGVDLIVEGKGRKFLCEVEIRDSWTTTDFPWDTLLLPLRKMKFAEQDCVFLIINRAKTHAMYVHSRNVRAADVVSTPNKVDPYERSISIPVSTTTLVPLLAQVK